MSFFQKTSPLKVRGWGGWEESAARAERSGAGAFRVCPLGGSEGRQGAASVRARCRADGGPEYRLAAQRPAGAVRRRRGISRCTDRSAGGCADRRTLATARARATAACHRTPPEAGNAAQVRVAQCRCPGTPHRPSLPRQRLAQRWVVHKSWGKRRALAGELMPPVEVQHPACCGSTWRSMAWESHARNPSRGGRPSVWESRERHGEPKETMMPQPERREALPDHPVPAG